MDFIVREMVAAMLQLKYVLKDGIKDDALHFRRYRRKYGGLKVPQEELAAMQGVALRMVMEAEGG